MSGRRQRHESVPWRARLSVKWRDYTLRRRAKRRAKEFVGMSPEQAELHADELGLRFQVSRPGVPIDEADSGRVIGSARDGVIEKTWVG